MTLNFYLRTRSKVCIVRRQEEAEIAIVYEKRAGNQFNSVNTS